MLNWKYYLAYLIVWPFILLNKIIFFEIEKKMFWDSDIWLHRISIWHDLICRYPVEEHTYEGKV